MKQKYPFSVIEDCLARLANKNVFTLLDLKESFHAIPISAEFIKYFFFATPDGQYEYVKLPFGYSESPAEFQKCLLRVLGLLIRSISLCGRYFETVDENLKILSRCLYLLKQHAFKVNYKKCQFLKRTVEYLGYILTNQGIAPSEWHVEAIKKFPVSRNIHELQRFLGLVSFSRRFVLRFAEIAKSFYSLLKKVRDI